jgi:hypothetical protein
LPAIGLEIQVARNAAIRFAKEERATIGRPFMREARYPALKGLQPLRPGIAKTHARDAACVGEVENLAG